MNIAELNAAIEDGTIDEIIAVAEARQCKALARIADDVCARPSVRLALLAGGSSAGKTTTAKRLATQIRVNDRAALHLSTDDYFVGDAKNPRDERGNLDYEHIDCVDRARLAKDVSCLLAGEAVPKRIFDFERHAPAYTHDMLTLPANGIIVLEGIHALNPILTNALADDLKYRVYIAPQPSLEAMPGILPTPQQARFLRRMVRDCHYRKTSPVDTIRRWPSVMAGEAKWIEPFSNLADACFDSYLVYELAALKPYVGGLLVMAQRELGPVREITDMVRLLTPILPINDLKIPGDSILRETIGGSQLEY